jgi:hypothetical protein
MKIHGLQVYASEVAGVNLGVTHSSSDREGNPVFDNVV